MADLKALPVWGVDVSSWQGPFAGKPHPVWSRVKAAGASFAFIKASQGSSHVHRAWTAYQWPAQAKAAGLLVGSYHFAEPGQGTPEQQADLYLKTIGAAATERGWFPPVLDIETTGGLPSAALRAWVDRFIKRIQAKTGKPPIVYTYVAFFNSQLGRGSGWLREDVPLWIAHYTAADAPGLARSAWELWQHTSTARVPGIAGDCDRNVFDGSLAELRALARIAPAPPKPPTKEDTVPTLDQVARTLTNMGRVVESLATTVQQHTDYLEQDAVQDTELAAKVDEMRAALEAMQDTETTTGGTQ
jgi:GH25 family lysozyme M1 (1,4-beta-N-acetylmuramidase)